jgi:hypothetical protein
MKGPFANLFQTYNFNNEKINWVLWYAMSKVIRRLFFDQELID